MALVESSRAPLLLLDDKMVVVGASASFCNTFNLDPATIANLPLAKVGAGEWDVPQLQSLLQATIAGAAEIDSYEMDLVRPGKATCHLVLSAHKLDYFDSEKVRVVLPRPTPPRRAWPNGKKTTWFARSRSCCRSCSTASPTACRSLPAF